MLRPALAAVLVAVAAPALAEGTCEHWTFGLVADEGGDAPYAFVCPVGDDHSLKLSCSSSGTFFLAYLPGKESPERREGYEGRFLIDVDADTFRRTALLQAMDNSLFIDGQKLSGPLIAALNSGKQVTIRPEDGSAKGDTFTLSGSTAALKSLAGACKSVW